eukprot:TRINITY_DN2740_c0_g1_i3.p1 TRINITY_DN2740_c0_g1~~TRINITY_DN2740_c0_g1_i3.p1  ORF type:complete len:374 (+),score=59.33 TRINITY_DN2740_c0_g1_i3:51-1172(+)
MYAQFVQAPMPQQQQQLQQQQQYMPFGPGIGGGVDYGGHRPSPSGASLKRVLHGPLEDKPLVSLIITICGGSSYDDLFRSIPQLAPSGRVSVFSAKPDAIPALRCVLAGDSAPPGSDEIAETIRKEVASIEPSAVVLNFECCSSCSRETFPSPEDTFPLIKVALDKGFMVMLSDFAVKALIAQWDEVCLGPNPFTKVGEFADSFDLAFDTNTLLHCASSQLQRVGELCENGKASLHALGGTIAFDVKPDLSPCDAYGLDVLTVATRLGGTGLERGGRSHVGDFKGTVGHAVLSYPSGGKLLLSCGHWVELSRLDVSVESVLKTASKTWGEAYSEQISTELKSASSSEDRERVVQMYAQRMVQQTSPCAYSSFS